MPNSATKTLKPVAAKPPFGKRRTEARAQEDRVKLLGQKILCAEVSCPHKFIKYQLPLARRMSAMRVASAAS